MGTKHPSTMEYTKAFLFASFMGIALAGLPPPKENGEALPPQPERQFSLENQMPPLPEGLPPPKENEERQMPPIPERQNPWGHMRDEDGYYTIDDMRYNEHQMMLFYGNELEQELARNAHPSPSARWTNGEMPYKFDSGVTAANQQMVKDSMDDFNTNFQGCLNVREATSSDTNYVTVKGANDGCWSYVGMTGGSQDLNLQPNGCMYS